nr:udp-glycosyltransferase 90a1 [Quercus suber]
MSSSICGDIDAQPHHVVLFPFMSKGHIIPILHLTRLLLHRHLAVTIFTTQANHAFITESLNDTSASILDLPFSHNVPDIPAGIESTEKLPSISYPIHLLTLQRSCNLTSNERFILFHMSASWSMSRAVATDRLLFGAELDDELITVTPFPWIRVTRNDFEPPFTEPEPKGLKFEVTMKAVRATKNSYGIIFNSFNELEPLFVDFWNRKYIPKAWSVGPLCLAEPPKVRNEAHDNYKPIWVQWLDKKLEQGNSVLYIAFGSQTEISPAQLKEIAIGLEESKVNFFERVCEVGGVRENGEGVDGRRER